MFLGLLGSLIISDIAKVEVESVENIFGGIMWIGSVVGVTGFVFLGIVEGGKVQAVLKNATLSQKLLGNVPVISTKEYKPVIKKYQGALLGIFAILASFFPSFFLGTTFHSILLIEGIIIIILSIIYGK